MLSDSAPASLAAIMTAARAGATEHAWAMFERSGYAQRDKDAAILAIKGRLLKDRGLYAQAAQAYAAADAIVAQPHTRINTATLTLLAGDATAARSIAQGLIDWQDRNAIIPETPYYLAATRAEALLLTGDTKAAEVALDDALRCNRDGWDDHAITLRQLRMILDTTGGDARWLDRFAPPRSVFFAGHLGVASGDSAALAMAVTDIVTRENIGFAYGALAAGADIVIAEAMLAAECALHIVLPTQPDDFAAQSVTGYGADWGDRYARCLTAATSVRAVTDITGRYEPLATQFAAGVAMGSAMLNAQMLQSEAAQLLVIDEGSGPYGDGLATAQIGAHWANLGRAQHLIRWPRSAAVVASGLKLEGEGRADRRLVAMLHMAIEGIDALGETAVEAAIDSMIIPLRDFAATIAVQPTMRSASGNAWIVAFDTPDHAWAYGRAMLAYADGQMPLRVTGHYGLVHWLDHPDTLIGYGVTRLMTLSSAAMPGILTASAALATAMSAGASVDFHAELIGEIDASDIYAITAR